MEDEHRKAIQTNFTSLVEQTDLDLMVSLLYEKGVFSELMIEPFKDTNRDVRTRKRQLFRDIMRRGPHAFDKLLEALTEAGYWDLVRDLDPNSLLHVHPRRNIDIKSEEGENSYVSLRTEKQKSKTGIEAQKITPTVLPPLPTDNSGSTSQFDVIKSTKFYDDSTSDIKVYHTRSRKRGVLLVFNYVSFNNDVDVYRGGVDVDCNNLKHLFSQIGFRVIAYRNQTKKETLEKLKSLKTAVAGVECLFVVVSSHGYERRGSDTDIRCHDGLLLSQYELLAHFNNRNFPTLRGVPKVFIFQLCRGQNAEYEWLPPPHLRVPESTVQDGAGAAECEGEACAGAGALTDGARPWTGDADERVHNRLYSDILIAHSTLPGYVSHRDGEKGSWYIQAVCQVFAARAHNCHVEKLFTLVDEHLHKEFTVQTSSIDKWGFNRRLYLHPGLYEEAT